MLPNTLLWIKVLHIKKVETTNILNKLEQLGKTIADSEYVTRKIFPHNKFAASLTLCYLKILLTPS